jgi:hypothetical protein
MKISFKLFYLFYNYSTYSSNLLALIWICNLNLDQYYYLTTYLSGLFYYCILGTSSMKISFKLFYLFYNYSTHSSNLLALILICNLHLNQYYYLTTYLSGLFYYCILGTSSMKISFKLFYLFYNYSPYSSNLLALILLCNLNLDQYYYLTTYLSGLFYYCILGTSSMKISFKLFYLFYNYSTYSSNLLALILICNLNLDQYYLSYHLPVWIILLLYSRDLINENIIQILLLEY